MYTDTHKATYIVHAIDEARARYSDHAFVKIIAIVTSLRVKNFAVESESYERVDVQQYHSIHENQQE